VEKLPPPDGVQLYLMLPATASEQSSACNIKDNISGKGERIYYVLGQKYYSQTRISTGKSERWFWSEREARAAGWGRSRQ
jgi:hypothetical protein